MQQFTAEWVEKQRTEWRNDPLSVDDLHCYRINYDIPGWSESPHRDHLPFGAALAIERLCCEVERLTSALVSERERCARIAEGIERPDERRWIPGSLYDTLRRETAAEIRRT